MTADSLKQFFVARAAWLEPIGMILGALAASWIAHRIVFAVADRWSRRTERVFDDSLVRHLRAPAALLFPVVALHVVLDSFPETSAAKTCSRGWSGSH